VLKNRWLWLIAAASFIASVVLDAPFPLIVLSAALLGMVAGRFAPALFEQAPGHAAAAAVAGPALIDDDTPLPAHAHLNWLRLGIYTAAGLALWISVLGALTVYFGWRSTLPQMGWFFTKAALLTFGGAYAVLPYVYQGAVEHYQWLTAAQMMDGLALGESTPGPLIMIVAFVGFLGAYGQQVFGPDAVVLAGVTGACVATFFTFLPSFLFILVGAPFVEATRRDIKFAAPLTCITAAVVGVILSLAVFLAGHVLWPARPGVGLDIFAACLGLAALVCLYRYKVNPLGILAVCALAGFVVRA
jgi:chromate transporter